MTRTAPRTSPTLLGRLRSEPFEEAAWTEFVTRYGTPIYQWCHTFGLQDADALDVTQAVLVRLLKRLRSFHYDPEKSFRNWLRVVTRHVVQSYLEATARVGATGFGASEHDPFSSLAAEEDLLKRLENAFDIELFEEACTRVRLQVRAKTWDAFRLTAIEGLSGADAGRALDMSPTAVFMARSNVQKRLRDAIDKLEHGRECLNTQ